MFILLSALKLSSNQSHSGKSSARHLPVSKVFLNNSLMRYVVASILCCSFISLNAGAATLTITDNLIVRDVDDKAVDHGFLSKKQQLELTPGSHSLVIKYKDVFEDIDFAEDRLVTSDYFVVKFTITNQQELLLTTRAINNLAAAERFVSSPELTLFDENKQELVLALEKLSDYKLAKQVAKVVTTLSVPTVISHTSTNNDNTANAITSEQTFSEQVIKNVDTVPMLKYWWQKASTDEKNKFLEFINKS